MTRFSFSRVNIMKLKASSSSAILLTGPVPRYKMVCIVCGLQEYAELTLWILGDSSSLETFDEYNSKLFWALICNVFLYSLTKKYKADYTHYGEPFWYQVYSVHWLHPAYCLTCGSFINSERKENLVIIKSFFRGWGVVGD